MTTIEIRTTYPTVNKLSTKSAALKWLYSDYPERRAAARYCVAYSCVYSRRDLQQSTISWTVPSE